MKAKQFHELRTCILNALATMDEMRDDGQEEALGEFLAKHPIRRRINDDDKLYSLLGDIEECLKKAPEHG